MNVFDFADKYQDLNLLEDLNEVLKDVTQYQDGLGYIDFIRQANFMSLEDGFGPYLETVPANGLQGGEFLQVDSGTSYELIREITDLILELTDYPVIDDAVYSELEHQERTRAEQEVIEYYLNENEVEYTEDQLAAAWSQAEAHLGELFPEGTMDDHAWYIPDNATTQDSLETILKIIKGK